MKEFKLTSDFKGYQSKKDMTNVDSGFLVQGSQNVLVNDGEKISVRRGYTIDGATNSSLTPIKEACDWFTSTSIEHHLRSYQDELEYRYVSPTTGVATWRRLANSFGEAVNFKFAPWWSSTESKDLLLFVNGDSNIRMWSGGVTEMLSATASTITKKYIMTASTIAFVSGSPATITDSAGAFLTTGFQAGDVIVVTGSTANSKTFTIGSVTADTITLVTSNTLTSEPVGTSITISVDGKGTWAEQRFLVSGTRQIVINGTTYTYTGGESTGTLTGVTPSPALEATGSIVHQAIRVTATTPASGVSNDVIHVNKNQVYIGDTNRRDVYVSKTTDYTSYTFSSPRIPGDGALLTLDNRVVGFESQDDGTVFISAGTSDWYQTQFDLSSDNTKELLSIKKLKSGASQGALSQALIGKAKNKIVYVSNEPTFDTLGRIENIDTPQAVPYSDPIKNEFSSYNKSDGHVFYFRNQVFIAFPAEGLVLIYDYQKEYWQPPQTLPVKRFSVIGGELYGHSSVTPETFKLFDSTTTSDRGNAINAVATFPYRSFEKRAWQKSFDEYYSEGYISSNTDIEVLYKYDFSGFRSDKTKFIHGDDNNIIFNASPDNSLGKQPLGKQPLGTVILDNESLLMGSRRKFRIIHELNKVNCYEYSVSYSSNQEDADWELLAHGPNVLMVSEDNADIKR